MSEFNPEAFCTPRTNAFRKGVLKRLNREPPPFDLELKCFQAAPFGSEYKWQFSLNLCRMRWPEQIVCVEKDGVLNDWFVRTHKACCRYKKLNLMGCASSGKSYAVGTYVYNMWTCSPFNTSVYVSSTTLESLNARIWRYIKNLHDTDKFKMGVRLDYRNTIVFQEDPKDKTRDYGDAIIGVAMKEGSDGNKALAAISGRKNVNVLWCCDEMAHMNVDILEGRLNLFANPFSQFIGMSNKPNEGDPMYIDAEPFGPEFPDGWKSVTPDMEGWPTKGGYCIYFDGEKSPNRGCPPGKPKFRGLITDEMIDQIREASGGDDSPGYWTQVRGFPQPGDIQDTVLTGKLIQSKQADQDVLWGPEEPVCVAGLDLGFRADGDPCVADFAKLGKDVDGITVLGHEPDTVQLVPKMQSKEPFEVQIADRFLAEAKPRGCRDVMVDVSSDGGIIAQALVRRSQETGQKLTVHLCSFLGTPDPDASYMSGGKRHPAKELFDRRVSELWYSYRISVTNGVIKGLKSGSKAVKELCQRKVMQDEKKRWVVEPKKEMKKRIRRSPDNGDARILSHAMACKKGLSGSGKAQPFNLRQEPVNPLAKKPPVYGGNPSKRALYSR